MVLYDARLTRGLSAFLGFPCFKVSVCFAGLLWLTRKVRVWPAPVSLRWRALLGHCLYTAAMVALAGRLWEESQPDPLWRLFWAGMLGGFLLTLGTAILPLQQWRQLPRRAWGHLGLTGLAALLVVTLTLPLNNWWSLDPGHALAVTTYWSTAALCRLVSSDVRVFPADAAIRVEGFTVQINHFCSGIEGMGLVWTYLTFYLWTRREVVRFPRALWVLPLGVALSLLVNILRLTLLILIGARLSPELAAGAFHSHAGWIAFTLVSWALVAGVERSGLLSAGQAVPNPAWAFLFPLGVWLLSGMVGQALWTQPNQGYPLRVALACLALYTVRKEVLEVLARPGPASLASGLLVYLIWLALVPAEASPELHPRYWLGERAWLPWLICRCLGTVVLVPIVEELAFRGFLLRRLQKRAFEQVEPGQLTPVALGVSSLAFGLLHQDRWAATLAGLVYGLTTRTRGGLSAAIVAHATTNLCIAIQVLGWQHWTLW